MVFEGVDETKGTFLEFLFKVLLKFKFFRIIFQTSVDSAVAIVESNRIAKIYSPSDIDSVTYSKNAGGSTILFRIKVGKVS
jgi:hypothetical protein